MASQEKNLDKNKRGRPAIGRGIQINAMLRPETVEALDAWRGNQSDPQPTRPQAVRAIVEKALASEGGKETIAAGELNAANDE